MLQQVRTAKEIAADSVTKVRSLTSYYRYEPVGSSARRRRIQNLFLAKPFNELWKALPIAQRRAAYRTGFIPVRGSRGRHYFVAADTRCNMAAFSGVYEYQPHASYDEPWLKFWCLIVKDCDPVDAALAKVMLLQADEPLFRKIAVGAGG